jgi:hypothetical protein
VRTESRFANVVWPKAFTIPDSLLDRADEVIEIELLFAAVLEAVPGTFATCRPPLKNVRLSGAGKWLAPVKLARMTQNVPSKFDVRSM